MITEAKELYFDNYKRNKSCGSFILIDPITNNTSAVGMIIDKVDKNELNKEEESIILNLSKLGIDENHYDVVVKIANELSKKGINIKIEKE